MDVPIETVKIRSSYEVFMFGYIHANAKELTEENKITYQAYYCGLCQQLKENCC